jgi:hypothetical protein
MLAHDRRVLDVPLLERLPARTSELLSWAKTMLPVTRYEPKRPRRLNTITHQSSRHPQLFLRSNSGHHGPHINHSNSSEPSSSQRAPPGYSAALSERTNQDGHAFLRHSPALPRHPRQCYLNPSDTNPQGRTQFDKVLKRLRGHTCRQSGSNQ